QRVVGGILGLALALHRDAQVHAPAARARGLELAARERERPRGAAAAATARGDADDDRLAAAVGEELLHGVAQRAVAPETAELLLVVRVAADLHRLVDRPAPGAAHEGRDRRRHAGDGADRARQLLDVD